MRIIINDDRDAGKELIELSNLLNKSPTHIVVSLINDYYARYKDANKNDRERENNKKLL